jgi:predicted lipid-binding transport protein (Tim44 family)
MTIQRLLILSAAALAASTIAGYAGPCSSEIDRMQARVDARLEANTAGGPAARESTAATMHRQPTPASIAAAESRLGEISSRTVSAISAAMARARKADRVGDKAACERALGQVQRRIGP